MCYSALDIGFWSTRPRESRKVNHTKMSPIWSLSLIFVLSCLCFLTEGKMAHGQRVGRQKKLKTTPEHT